jgi:hypothetical protein
VEQKQMQTPVTTPPSAPAASQPAAVATNSLLSLPVTVNTNAPAPTQSK